MSKGERGMTMTVKAARVNAGKTQEEVAAYIGLSTTAYKRKENGQRRFYIDEIVGISILFKMDVINFFESQCRNKTQEV